MALGYTDLWSAEANTTDAFTPLALASVWTPTGGEATRAAWVGEVARRLRTARGRHLQLAGTGADGGFGAVGVSSGRERVGDAGALFSAIAGRVDLCGGRSFGRLHPRGCGGFLAGAALAAGQGFARATSSTLPWLAVPIGAHLEVRLTDRFGLDLGVEGLVGVTRPVFEGLTQRSELVSRAYARFGVLAGVGFTFLIWSP